MTRFLVGVRRGAFILTSAGRRSTLIVLSGYCMMVLSAPATAGTAFGIYDARTLAMGGASVASANNDNAQFYNAALLAFNEEIEERTQDSRFLFPLLIPQAAESAITIEELSQDDPTGAMTRAVNDFNAISDATTAQAVVDVASNLDTALAELDGEDLFADGYFGLAISEPGKFQGAGFFMGARLLAGGQPTVSEADRAILAAYQEGLTFIASDGAQGAPHPELFDANGALMDPGNDFDSTVSAAGAIIAEAGVAMSRQVHVFGQALAAGFSFKVQRIDTFEDTERIVDDRIDPSEQQRLLWSGQLRRRLCKGNWRTLACGACRQGHHSAQLQHLTGFDHPTAAKGQTWCGLSDGRPANRRRCRPDPK